MLVACYQSMMLKVCLKSAFCCMCDYRTAPTGACLQNEFKMSAIRFAGAIQVTAIEQDPASSHSLFLLLAGSSSTGAVCCPQQTLQYFFSREAGIAECCQVFGSHRYNTCRSTSKAEHGPSLYNSRRRAYTFNCVTYTSVC